MQTVYHHTSTLRTNLIWMSGVIDVEGQCGDVVHPQIGKIMTDATRRRALKDFAPVAWFTTRVDVPRCLMRGEIQLEDKTTGAVRRVHLSDDEANTLALRRVCLGFPLASISAVPWVEHPGYRTVEGAELNETGRDAGDNPDDWYVSESPVDVALLSEAWVAKSILRPKMQRQDWYVADIKAMVAGCRATPGAYIPPAWLTPDQAGRLASRLGVAVAPL